MSKLPDDFFENDNWKLVIRPVWIRKNDEKVISDCVHCNGRGFSESEELFLIGSNDRCHFCDGTGKVQQLKQIDPPPDLSDSRYEGFREGLQKFMNDFGK